LNRAPVILLGALFAALLMTSPVLAEPPSSWPSLQGGPEHLGSISDSGLQPPLRTAWRSSPGVGGLAGVVVKGDLGLVTGNSAVIAFDVSTGTIKWTVPRASGPLVPGALDQEAGRDGALVFAEGAGPRRSALAALDLRTRRRLWSANVGPIGAGGPTVSDGVVFVGTTSRSVLAIDGKSGRIQWRVATEGAVDAAPAVANGRVFAVSNNARTGRARLYALRAEGCGAATCRPVWTFSPPGFALGSSAATVFGSTVYVGFGDSGVRAFDAITGRLQWTGHTRTDFSERTSPALSGNQVFLQDGVGGVYRFNAGTGDRVWDFQFAPTVRWGAPLFLSGRPSFLYVGLDDGTVAAIQGETGRLRWRTRLGSGSVGAFAAVNTKSGPLLLVPSSARRGAIVALQHDPSGRLVDVKSPTELRLGVALGNFAVAFVALLLALAGLFGLLTRRSNRLNPT
jgi:outer membrane protein assembly factor BamB